MHSAAPAQLTDDSSFGSATKSNNLQPYRNISKNRCIRWLNTMLSFRTAKEESLPFLATRRNSLITLYLPVSMLWHHFLPVKPLWQRQMTIVTTIKGIWVKNGQHIPPYTYFYNHREKREVQPSAKWFLAFKLLKMYFPFCSWNQSILQYPQLFLIQPPEKYV